VDAEELARLRALGYVGAEGAPELGDELASLTLHGPDPSTRTRDIAAYVGAAALADEGKASEAEYRFRWLHERNPQAPRFLGGLLETLLDQGRTEEALPFVLQALELEPDAVGHRLNLAKIHRSRGEVEATERVLREALALAACNRTARLQLAELLRRESRESDGGSHPDYLDTLAATFAETGDFERAVSEQRRALALVEGRDLPAGLVEPFREHLALYEAGLPLRVGATRGP